MVLTVITEFSIYRVRRLRLHRMRRAVKINLDDFEVARLVAQSLCDSRVSVG